MADQTSPAVDAADTIDPATGMTPREAADELVNFNMSAYDILSTEWNAGIASVTAPKRSQEAISTVYNWHARRTAAADELAKAAKSLLSCFSFDHLQEITELRNRLAAYDAAQQRKDETP